MEDLVLFVVVIYVFLDIGVRLIDLFGIFVFSFEDDGMVRREPGGFEFADLSGGFLLMRFGGNDIETGGLDE